MQGAVGVIEFATFALAPRVTEAELMSASDRLESEFLAAIPGYRGRTLVQLPDGRYADIAFWRDTAAAESVMGRVAASPAAAAYFACMVGADPNDPAAGVQHFRAVRGYPRGTI